MTHFGIISPPVSGHIHPFSALGRELLARGHRVTYFQVPDLAEKIHGEGLEFWPIGSSDHPRGSLPRSLDELARLRGVAALRFTIRAVARTSEMVCRDAPQAIRAAGVDALLVDQMEPAGGAVAEHLGVPFITLCNALAINSDSAVPPPFTPWSCRDTFLARWRNQIGYAASNWLTGQITRVVAHYRSQWKLPPLRSPDDSFSPLAQICQMPREFDFPRATLPESFQYVGPLRRSLPVAHPFPWERLDGRPLVYSSLGTLQNRREPLFRCFAEACRELGLQLVIAHGGGLTESEAAALPGRPLAVAYAPQLDVLARATLTLTHAGLNTVLDSLSAGVPLLAVPITYEQPAIARRIEWTGSGKSISLPRLTVKRLVTAVRQVLHGGQHRENAKALAEAIRAAGGVRRAADIAELALSVRGGNPSSR